MLSCVFIKWKIHIVKSGFQSLEIKKQGSEKRMRNIMQNDITYDLVEFIKRDK